MSPLTIWGLSLSNLKAASAFLRKEVRGWMLVMSSLALVIVLGSPFQASAQPTCDTSRWNGVQQWTGTVNPVRSKAK